MGAEKTEFTLKDFDEINFDVRQIISGLARGIVTGGPRRRALGGSGSATIRTQSGNQTRHLFAE